MKKYIDKIISQRKIILFLCVLLMTAGVFSYYYIPKEENPDTTFPIAMITTVYPGATPEEVEQYVTIIIEDSIADMESLAVVKSHSMDSYSVVIAEFNIDCDWQNVKYDLNSRIDQAQNKLPESCGASEVKVDLADTADFIISLSGDSLGNDELQKHANEIKSSLETIDGVSKIQIQGQQESTVDIVLNPQKLDAYNISSEQIIELVSAQNIDIPSGSIEHNDEIVSVSTNTEFKSTEDIKNIVVYKDIQTMKVLTLGDIADIKIENVQDSYYEQDGMPAILICGYFDKEQNAVLIGKQVRSEIDLIKKSIDDDIVFHEVLFSPEDVASSISGFMISLVESIALIVFIVMIGVRFKNGIIISITLPFSILFAFIVMYILKIEFQFITIAALIISLGILVDNAVVVSDCIQRNLDEGKEKKEAISQAIKETAIPILTSSITTIIAFGTIYFFSGPVGAVAETIPTVVIAALSASYIAAMVIIPALAYMLFSPMKKDKKHREGFVKRIFIKLLGFGLKHKIVTIIFSVATLCIALLLFTQLGLSFFPYSDKEIIYIDIESNTMNMESTQQAVEEVCKVLDGYSVVENYTAGIGTPLPRFFMTLPYKYDSQKYAQIMVQLDLSADEKYRDNESVATALQKDLDGKISGADCSVNNLEYAYPSDAKVEIMLMGNDLEQIKMTAQEAKEALEKMDSTQNVSIDITENAQEFVIDINERAAAGFLKYDIAKQINTALMGYNVSTIIIEENALDIVVTVDINNIDELKRLPITSSINNEQVLLRDIADISLADIESSINRYNGQRYIKVLADTAEGYSSFDVKNEFENQYRDEVIPEEVDVTYLGEIANMNKFLNDAWLITLYALLLIYIVLLIQFKCFKRALIILITIPLSLAGCFLGLYIFGADIQAMAILGMIALFGIVVNNGIILIEYMDSRVKEGCNIEDACIGAVSVRYRPIVISAVTTCIGLIPLIFSGDPMSAPMAMVLFFGLMFSTVLTMVVVPVMYAMIKK